MGVIPTTSVRLLPPPMNSESILYHQPLPPGLQYNRLLKFRLLKYMSLDTIAIDFGLDIYFCPYFFWTNVSETGPLAQRFILFLSF